MGRKNNNLAMVSFYLGTEQKKALLTLAAIHDLSQGECFRRVCALGLQQLQENPGLLVAGRSDLRAQVAKE